MAPKVILKLKPEAPMVWTTNNTLQFGLDTVLFKTALPSAEEQALLLALREGKTREEMEAIATHNGILPAKLQDFYHRYSDVIEKHSFKLPPVKPTLSIIGHFDTESFLAIQLQRRSWVVTAGALKRGAKKQVVVTADRYFPGIQQHHRLLYDGHSVLPSRFGDQTVLIGPVVSNYEEHETIMQQWYEINPNISNKQASQICHLQTPTERESLLLMFSGIVLEQLQAFMNPASNSPKTYQLSRFNNQISVKAFPVNIP